MAGSTWIEHRGRRVLYDDFRDVADPREALELIRRAREMVAAEPPRSVRILTNVAGAHFDSAVIQAMKDFAAHNTPYVVASAVVGLSGLQRVAYRAVTLLTRRNIPAFDDETAALDWLVAQAADAV